MRVRFFKGLMMTLITLILLISFLLLTNWGNRLLLHAVNNTVTGLSIELEESSVLASPTFSQVSYHANQQRVDLKQIELAWDWGCLWHSKICIKSINIDKLNIELSTVEEQKTKSAPLETIQLPFGFTLSQLAIARTSVKTPEQQLKVNDLLLSFNAQQSTIENIKLDVAHIELISSSQEPKQSEPFDIQTFDPSIVAHTRFPKLPMAIALERLAIKEFSQQSPNSARNSLRDIDMSFSISNQKLSLKTLSVKHQTAQLLLSGDIENKPFMPHNVRLQAVVTKTPDLDETTIELSSQGRIDDLVLDFNSQGPLQVNGKVSLDLSKPTLPITIQTQWQPTTLPFARKVNLAGGEFELTGNRHHFTYDIQSGISSEAIPNSKFKFKGYGSQLDLHVEQGLIDTLDGNIQTSGMISWERQLTSSIIASLTNIQPHTFWPDLQGNISGALESNLTLSNQDWAVNINTLALNGSWLDQPLLLDGKINGQSDAASPYGRWDLENVTIKSGDNSLQANGVVTESISLQSQINAPNINQSLPQVEGAIIGEFTLSGETTAPNVIANLTVNNLLSAEHSLQIKHAKLAVNAALIKQLPIDAKLTLHGLQYQQQSLDVTELTLTGNAANHQLSLNSTGSPINAQFQLTGQQNDKGWSGRLNQASLTTPLDSWRLAEHLKIEANQQQQTISIQAHCWLQDSHKTQLCLNQDFELDAKNKSSNIAKIRLSDFDLTQLNPFISQPITFSGTLSSDIVFELKPDNKPYLHSETSVSKGVAKLYYKEREINHEFDSFSSQAIIDEKLSSLNLHARSKSLGNIGVTLLTNVFMEKPQLTGHVQVDGLKLSPYQALIPDISRIEGQLHISTGFTGDLMEPLFFGDVAINDITIATTRVPTTIENLNSQLELQGQKALWTSDFELGKGKGQFNGEVNWQNKLTALLDLKGDELKVSQRKDLYVVFSPQLTVEMTPSLTKVRGDVVINDGLVKVEKLPKSAVSLSDDVKIKSIKKEQIVPLDINISVLIDEALQVDAFGLNSRLKGNLNLLQTATQPLSGFGDLGLVDATYRAMGQNLLINKGQLIFTGVLQNPLLNIEAIRDPSDTDNDVIAGLYITGNTKVPQLTIFSNPALPQQEALSYLLRGKALDASSDASGTNMAISMLLDSGIGQSNQMIGELGDSLGIDQLSLNTSGSGDSTKIEVSGYIAPKLQLRYGVGVFDGTPEVGLRYQLSHKFFVEFVNDTGQALDLLYKFSFN